MQNHIEEDVTFEAEIRDNLFKLLSEIKKKMYDLACAKYEYATLMESLKRILECKQGDEETLVDYTKKFKQA
jgi:hypothetical protein